MGVQLPYPAPPGRTGSHAWHARLQPASISHDALHAAKWIALAAMTADHLNKFVLTQKVPALFAFGRIAMPLFAIALGLNLASACRRDRAAIRRTVMRLLFAGAAATPPYILLGAPIASGWPLNAMFTLAVGALVIGGLTSKARITRAGAIAVFIIGGVLVEFWWPAVALTVGSWLIGTQRLRSGVVLGVFGFAGLCLINQNLWALAALPLLILTAMLPLRLPRLQMFFYVYYPAHLAALCVLVHLGH